MNDRFKFNAIITSYYDIDTPEKYEEIEPQFYLKNIDVFSNGEIGIFYDNLLDAVRKQSPDLTEKEIAHIMQHLEDNSNSPECDFVTITPKNIIQCTGLKDKNGKLIFEGDILKISEFGKPVEVKHYCLGFILSCEPTNIPGYHNDKYIPEDCEVIGNIYENPELLQECE